MRLLHAFLWIVARIVPACSRRRWLEEWRAELAHGRWTMVFGAPRDAWALRRLRGNRSGKREPLFHAFPQDVRYALRGLFKAPGFTLAAIASLSIGIAASAGAFTFVNAMAFRPFPGVTDQDSLVYVRVLRPRGRYALTASHFQNYATLRDGLTTLSGLSAHFDTNLAVGRVATPADVPGAVVSGNYFEVLGVEPAAGRFFAPEEDATPWSHPAAVISYRLWERMLDGDRSALNQWITVNGTPVQIVGVAPRRFSGVQHGEAEPDVWITFALSELAMRDEAGRPAHASRVGRLGVHYVGRLTANVTLVEARAQASTLEGPLTAIEGEFARAGVSAVRRGLGDRATPAELAGVLAVPLIVLAIACVNAANLLLARASARAVEWRVRLALGSTRWRIVRQILTESLLVSLGAAAVGLLLTSWSLRLLEGMLPVPLSLDWRVLSFTIGIAMLTALVFGIGPAVAATRADMQRAPAGGCGGIRPGGRRMRAGLIAVQAALALSLLISGAQLTRTVLLANVFAVPDADRLLVASFDLDKLRYTPQEAREFYQRLAADAQKLPGARAAVVAGGDLWGPLPFEGQLLMWTPVDLPGNPREAKGVYTAGDLHAVLGLPLTSGRRFVAGDHAAALGDRQRTVREGQNARWRARPHDPDRQRKRPI